MIRTQQKAAGGKPTVIEALRRFMPAHLSAKPALSAAQHRAVWAVTHCRTAMLGGSAHGCADCNERYFAYHSCNNKACPQCGRAATMKWVQREEDKRVSAPYFMVTLTLPSELRPLFFGPEAKAVYDTFFFAASQALSEKLADRKNLGAVVNGFSMVLHTWTQQMMFHPHIHCIVPGAGLDAQGNYVQVKNDKFLLSVAALSVAFRHYFGAQMKQRGWQCDPSVWRKDWGVNIQPFGDGQNAIKYLGRYVTRSVIGDARIVNISHTHVTFRYKDRGTGKAKDRAKRGQERLTKVEGSEFVKRYLRHVLPDKLRGVRHYGFNHPAAKNKRSKVREKSLQQNGAPPQQIIANCETPQQPSEIKSQLPAKAKGYPCPCCNKPMLWMYNLPKAWLGASYTRHSGPSPPV